jgi:hypothetical protein
MPNDEGQMTKEGRMTNDEWPGDEAGHAELEFWGVKPECDIMVLREEAASKQRVYDLEERTAQFGEALIRFAKKIPPSPANNRLVDQLVGAGTSVGAKYCEADDGVSKKDFLVRWHVQEGGTRDEVLSAHGGGFRASVESRGARALERGQGAAPDFQRHLAKGQW